MNRQLKALADPVRLEILRGLSGRELQAGEIASVFDLTRPAISHHLRVLADAGLIRMRRDAQSRLYSIDVDAVMELRSQFNGFWDQALPKLKAVIGADLKAKRKGGNYEGCDKINLD